MQILGTSQVGRQTEITDFNFVQVGISEVGVIHDGFSHNSSTQIGSTEIGSSKVTVVHPTPSQVSSTEVSIGEVSSTQIGSTQIRSTEVNITQINLDKEIFFRNGASDHNPTQVDFSEGSMPRSIEPAKFISSHLLHENTPLLNTIYSTAQTLWHTTTPIDLTFKIQDLPTGQLAEGTITSYNSNGTLKTATITIDNDANGVGWHIDPTPWDNSEFSTSLTDTAYRATADSAAYGHYDLLTTLLHETSQLQGFIAGYSTFDSHILSKPSTEAKSSLTTALAQCSPPKS
jgi:hypothetical protein